MPAHPSNMPAVRYSVVVPVYESTHSVRELVRRLQAVFEDTLGASYEIILIDDGSRSPETWKTLEVLAAANPCLLAIRLMRNYGKAGAVLCGLHHIRGSWVITIDDDLQQAPEDIIELIKYEDHDVVIGNFGSRYHSRFTVFTSWIKSHFTRIILRAPFKMSPLKLFKAEVARGMLHIRSPHPFIPALMAHVTSDFVSVQVSHHPSEHGKSRYSFVHRFKQFSNLLIGNSSLLLRYFGIFGLLVSIFGLVLAVYVIVRKILGITSEPGWSSLMIINLLFGGLILTALSIIGEYLIRILESTTQKPPYIIREVVQRTYGELMGAEDPLKWPPNQDRE